MELVLHNSEFVALAALLGADDIIGVNPAALMPAEKAGRQQVYERGESSLAQRGLLRVNDRNEAVLEQDVLRMARIVAQPKRVALLIKTSPVQGRQIMTAYARNGQFVERSEPDAERQRLADLGDSGAVAARICELLPINPAEAPVEAAVVSGALVSAMTKALGARARDEARALLQANEAPANSVATQFLADLVDCQYFGTVSMMKAETPDARDTREAAIVQGPVRAWVVTASAQPELLGAQRLNVAQLRSLIADTLDSLA